MTIHEPDYAWSRHPGLRTVTEYLILHHAAGNGSAEAVHAYHQDTNGWAGIAYHYYVRLNGEIYRGRGEDWNGGHTSGYHHNSIGVCFEGDFEKHTMPFAQLQAGRELVADILSRYPGIAVAAHRDLGATSCPGKHFPMAEMLAAPAKPESPADYAAASCGRAVAKGVFQGDGQGNYGWADPVTRQDLCVILGRLGLL